MTPLDAARELGAMTEADLREATDYRIDCGFCGGAEIRDGERPSVFIRYDHHPTCPWLAMPRIVAALEAAERLTQADEPTQELRVVECVYCGANRDLPHYGHEDHKPGCLWQALVDVLCRTVKEAA